MPYLFQGGRLVISEEITHSLNTNSSIPIALESAIITHGMPYPANLTTTESLMEIITSHPSGKVIPAPIAIIDSVIYIGLSSAQLQRLSDPQNSSSPNTKSIKVSKRDLPYALSRTGDERINGGTTVAGTMIIAKSVGIDLFVTGGIGGAHRGAQNSAYDHDIRAADLATSIVCCTSMKRSPRLSRLQESFVDSVYDIRVAINRHGHLGRPAGTLPNSDGCHLCRCKVNLGYRSDPGSPGRSCQSFPLRLSLFYN